jgi:hypothetical protein
VGGAGGEAEGAPPRAGRPFNDGAVALPLRVEMRVCLLARQDVTEDNWLWLDRLASSGDAG